MEVVLFYFEEMDVGMHGGVVDDDPEHEEGAYAEDEVGEEGAEYGEEGFHLNRQK